MSTQIKIGIGIILALGVAYAFWPRDDENKLPEVPETKVGRATPPAETKTIQMPSVTPMLATASCTCEVMSMNSAFDPVLTPNVSMGDGLLSCMP